MASTAFRIRRPGRRVVLGVFSVSAFFLAMCASGVLAQTTGYWKAVRIQAPADIAEANSLGGLFANMACVTASDCWSAGSGLNRAGGNVPFIEHWTGTRFQLARTPVRNAHLQGLVCVARDDCWVAGGAGHDATAYNQIGHYRPLLEHWNGRGWEAARTPNPGRPDTELSDVSCLAKTDCYAVGWTATGSGSAGLVEHWTGKQWQVVPGAQVTGQQFVYLVGIVCLPRSVCNIVGQEQAGSSSPPHVFGERGVGRTWSVVSMPSPSNSRTALYGLACASAADCLATGSAYVWPSGGLNPGEAIAEHWNGRSWSLVSPGLAQANRLSDVSCTSRTDCWAVGSTFTDTIDSPAVVAHWNGSTFTQGQNANPYRTTQLDAVGCVSSSRCLSVGIGESGNGVPHPVALEFRLTNSVGR